MGGNKIRFMAHLVDCNRHCNITMVLKTGTVKEPKNVLIIGFMVEPMTS